MIYIKFLTLYFKTFNKYFNIGLAFSLFIQFLIFVYFDPNSQTSISKFVNFLSNASLSFISAYIFYFIYPHAYTQTKKAYLFRFYNNRLLDIIQIKDNLHFYFCNRFKREIEFGTFPNDYLWNDISKINPNDPLVYGTRFDKINFLNLFDFLKYFNDIFNKNLNELLLLKEYIDPDILIILLNIKDIFIDQLNGESAKSYNIKDSQFFLRGLMELFNLMIDLNSLFITEKVLYANFFHNDARKRNIEYKSRRIQRQ